MDELSASDMENASEYSNPDDYWLDCKAATIGFALLPAEDRHTMDSVCQSFLSAAGAITSGWQESPDIWDLRLVTQALDSLWFHVCWEGMTRSSALEQQQIVHAVGVLKNRGVAVKSSASGLVEEEVVISGEKIWTDLPGLQTAVVDVLQGLKRGSYPETPSPAEHWKNLHALAARLSACGVSDSLRSCGVWALRCALEEEEGEESRVPMVQRLEAVEIWLSSHGFWLESVACYSKIGSRPCLLDDGGTVRYEPPCSSLVVPLGQLAVAAGIAGAGLVSWDRWEFWQCRLEVMENGQPSEVSAKARTLLRYIAIE